MSTPIKGYRVLSDQEIAEINHVKAVGERVEAALASIESLPGHDPRWLAIARTHLQVGFMAASRSIAKPETFA